MEDEFDYVEVQENNIIKNLLGRVTGSIGPRNVTSCLVKHCGGWFIHGQMFQCLFHPPRSQTLDLKNHTSI